MPVSKVLGVRFGPAIWMPIAWSTGHRSRRPGRQAGSDPRRRARRVPRQRLHRRQRRPHCSHRRGVQTDDLQPLWRQEAAVHRGHPRPPAPARRAPPSAMSQSCSMRPTTWAPRSADSLASRSRPCSDPTSSPYAASCSPKPAATPNSSTSGPAAAQRSKPCSSRPSNGRSPAGASRYPTPRSPTHAGPLHRGPHPLPLRPPQTHHRRDPRHRRHRHRPLAPRLPTPMTRPLNIGMHRLGRRRGRGCPGGLGACPAKHGVRTRRWIRTPDSQDTPWSIR
jgi:hypothetical protein